MGWFLVLGVGLFLFLGDVLVSMEKWASFGCDVLLIVLVCWSRVVVACYFIPGSLCYLVDPS